MLKTKPNAFEVAEATLGKVTGITKPVSKFIIHILGLWLGMNCRYVFTNMERWGTMNEKSYRNAFKKFFDWFSFNMEVLKAHAGKEIVAVFDPSYIGKSGKKTHGLGMFWSGTSQRAQKGLEIGCLAFVDVTAGTALHGKATQTPSPKLLKQQGKSLVGHYLEVIGECITKILAVTRYLAVDGYFMKKDFINPLLSKGLHVITKARSDANLMYIYKGTQKKGRGRKKRFDGKIDTNNINARRLRCCYRDNSMKIYAGVVYSVVLKCEVLGAFVYYGERQKPEIIICTDTQMEVMKMCQYYDLRFQIEFLIRDAKQHCGLEDCMARDAEKLGNHFNVALTAVSIAKAAYHLPIPKEERGSFSMADIKMRYMNQLIAKRIFSNLDLDMSCRKIRRIYNECLNFGRIRA